jgi:hypothetical protein
MSKFSKLIRSVKEKLFGREQEPLATEAEPLKPEDVRERFPYGTERKPDVPVEPSQPKGAEEQVPVQTRQQRIRAIELSAPPKEAKRPVIESSPPTALASKRQQPYFIQIGFDFGTSFSKCVCRDVMTDKAWVQIPSKFKGHELPFLIPSALLFMDGKFQDVQEQGVHYPEGGLYHLKHALVKIALAQLDDPVLEPYRRASEQADVGQLAGFVESCAVYFLAGALGAVREQIRQRMTDFGKHPDDYMAVNLAVPVADAEQPDVNRLYHAILCEAWSLADTIQGHPSMDLKELKSLRQQNSAAMERSASEACFIYPEVSANVQGFVRSRVSSPGIYLFSDTGAGTVDQSAFIFFRKPDNSDHLTYLHGNVLPCGSSHIEFQAARISGKMDHQTLEMWRERKERGGTERELVVAKNMLEEQLVRGTRATLACTKNKLFVKEQLRDMRVIFGGGGHCEHPYKKSVMIPFSGDLFRRAIRPDVVGLPIPIDLDLGNSHRRWMSRLTVAYGLSFERSDLTGFTYPKDVEPPEPDQVWRKRRDLPGLVTKDQC